MHNLYFALIYIVAFAIPFPFVFGAASIVLLLTGFLLLNRYRETFKTLKQQIIFWPSLIFFILNAVSYFYSYDKAQSLFDTQSKLSFLVMPILIGAGPSINKKQLERIFSFYVLGVCIMAIFCIMRASIIYMQTGHTEQFFYHKLVVGCDVNAVYFSLYVFLALIALLFYDWHSHLRNSWAYNIIYFILIVFFILLSSKTLLVLFVVIIIPFSIVYNIRLKRNGLNIYIGYALQILLVCSVIFTNNPIRSRFEDLTKNNDPDLIQHGKVEPNQKFNNFTLRLLIWRTGIDNINENKLYWIGCGNGSVKHFQKDMMLKLYGPDVNKNQDNELWEFNLHNAYLQTLMMTGISGLLMLLLIVFMPFLHMHIVPNHLVFLLFFAVNAIFMMQESTIQTQAGIVFLSFFSNVFWNVYLTSSKEELAAVTAT